MIKQSTIILWFRKIFSKHNNSYDAKSIMYDYADYRKYGRLLEINEYIQINSKPITPPENITFSFGVKDVRKVFGKPSTTVQISIHPKIKIYLYKKIQNDHKLKFMFHYFNNKIVMITRILPYAPDNVILDEQNRLLESFELPTMKDKKLKMALKDSEGNLLISSKNIQYFEYYLSNDDSFREFVKKKTR